MEDRSPFQVLHPNVPGQSCLLVGSDGNLSLNTHNRGKKRKNNENVSSSKCRRKDKIYTDSEDLKKPMKTATKSTQTDPVKSTSEPSPSTAPSASTPTKSSITTPEQEIIDMLTDKPSEKYWEVLAETRRQALQKTLEENQKLHETNQELKNDISVLKEEIKLLDDMVEEAKQLATLVQSVTGDETSET